MPHIDKLTKVWSLKRFFKSNFCVLFKGVYRYNKYIAQQHRHVTISSRGVVVVIRLLGHVH